MSTPNFAEISALITVLEQRSFANAAKHLGLSPPRVSELVRSLEDRVGVRLVERTTRSVAASEAGEQLLSRLRNVLDEYQAALESLSEFRSKPAGTLRLTVSPFAANFILAPVVARFLALYPEIRLDISVDITNKNIVAERFDAGIRPGELLERDMIAVRVSDGMRFVVVAAPCYLAGRGAPETPQDLLHHDVIRLRFPDGALYPLRFRSNGRAFELQAEGRLTVNGSVSLLLKAALDGVGLVQAPLQYAKADLAAGRLVSVLDKWAPPQGDGAYLYYSSRHQIRPALKALIDFLRHEYRNSSGGESAKRATA